MSARDGLPRPARWLLERLLPDDVADALIGDLEERLRDEIRPARGPLRARLWVWGQILSLRLPSLWRAAGRGRSRQANGASADLRHAARALRRDPGFTLVVVATLGIAIGATTLAFSVVDGVLLRPLPWPEQERLVQLHTTNAGLRTSDSEALRAFAERMPVSYPQLRDWAARDDVFAAVGALRPAQPTVDIDGAAEQLTAPGVSPGLLRALGVTPLLGRIFREEDDHAGGAREVVLSYGTWQRRFGADPRVLGRTLRVRGEPHAIVGVMPPSFWFPDPETELWTTLPDAERNEDRGRQGLMVFARLRDGVTLARAQTTLDALAERLAATHPEQAGYGANVTSLRAELVGGVERTLVVLLGAVGLVLLVACINVANLMLVRATARGRELAVRSALGAGRARLVRSGFAEALLVALCGGALGIALAAAGLRPLLAVVPASVPRLEEVTLDVRVLAFAGALAFIAAAAVGILPGLRAARTAPAGVLKEGGRTASHSRRMTRIQSVLVVAQVAVACVLVVGGALLATSYGRLLSFDRGFEPDGLALWTITLPGSAYADAGRAGAFFEALAARAGGLPGVTATAWATEAPFSGSLRTTSVVVDDAPALTVDQATVSPDFFALMGVPLLAGRGFEAGDDPERGGVVVSRALAQRFWPGASPLGRVLRTGSDARPRTVIGVVGDVAADATRPPGPKLYAPIGPGRQRILVMRTSLAPAALAGPLRDVLRTLDPNVPPREPVFVGHAMQTSVAPERFRALLIGGLAAIAAFLAVLGVYGLIAWRVASRLPDIGVRLALGAGAGRIVRDIVADGARLAVAGTAIGLAGALGLTRTIASFLFGVAPADAGIYVATGLALTIVALLASWLPARRAAAVDPATVLTTD
ncbi:MAG TPA: ADOP family duplicated permease [Albitalea sp.]